MNDQHKFFAIELKSENRVVGHIEFYPWFGDHTYEIGWALHAEQQGKGYAFEAARALLTHGFESLNLQRVIATCQPDNHASVQLAERLQMRREGHFKQCLPRDNDNWWDEYFYAMLQEDFEKLANVQSA
ncbi:GNAT family N-acetyltransferase [Vibrio sonorensis]|uniref:GNAT family N-acetyltransferase n=1 Tax=Vibrio sonorensis TaxID=1004316 RepID=UPI000AF97007|nr:GNAT family protein [Vibrio sonorensis]